MIPQTILALVGFLFLVAPGLVFEIRRERRRPALEETAFREASRTALASVFFSLLAVTILAGVRARWPEMMPDPGRWLREGNDYLRGSYQTVAWFFVAELILACGLAFGVERVLGWKRGATIRSVPIWHRVFRQELPSGKEREYLPFVGVRLSDGTEYSGLLAGYSTEYRLADRELALAPPLFRRLPGDTAPHSLSTDWQRLIIRGPEIRDLWVAYRPVDHPRRRRLRSLRWRDS